MSKKKMSKKAKLISTKKFEKVEIKLEGNLKSATDYVNQTARSKNKARNDRAIKRFTKFLDYADQVGQAPIKQAKDIAQNKHGITVVPVDSNNYVIRTTPNYVTVGAENEIFDAHLDSGVPLLLVGPKGTGKTLAVANWAAKKKIPFIQYDCSEGSKSANLVGTWTMASDRSTPFKLGVIPTIIECANQFGVACLCLEELSALSPAMQKQLNPLLDWRRGMFVEQISQYYNLRKDAKLIIFATMNPSSYAASNELNEDLMSRFAIWQWTYPQAKYEKKIIAKPLLGKTFVKNIMNLAKESRAMHKTGAIDYPISTRDMDLLTQCFLSYKKIKSLNALQMALETIVLGKYEEEDQKAQMKSRIESIFGADATGDEPEEAKEDEDGNPIENEQV